MKKYNHDEAWNELIECYRVDEFRWVWYEDKVFWFVLGIVVGILLIINYYR